MEHGRVTPVLLSNFLPNFDAAWTSVSVREYCVDQGLRSLGEGAASRVMTPRGPHALILVNANMRTPCC